MKRIAFLCLLALAGCESMMGKGEEWTTLLDGS